ncbi:hypothetical protein TDIS_1501 [Thermosulfurimonas dismutans]|uniref:Uncharacterized protein n=1 Tax=Thermosulfurimonas dismutans TaxID=999894 RepID=A0A179D316_9BACT|nr:hypothetical protein TDIS_1501 [Thermosulfurimonas dismutans]
MYAHIVFLNIYEKIRTNFYILFFKKVKFVNLDNRWDFYEKTQL